MKIKILGTFSYQSFPETEGMIEVNEDDLKKIGITKKFDVELQKIVNYDNTNVLLIKEKKEWVNFYKNELSKSDYKAIKFAEGELSEIEYNPIREERKNLRKLINTLEEEIEELKQGCEEDA